HFGSSRFEGRLRSALVASASAPFDGGGIFGSATGFAEFSLTGAAASRAAGFGLTSLASPSPLTGGPLGAGFAPAALPPALGPEAFAPGLDSGALPPGLEAGALPPGL